MNVFKCFILSATLTALPFGSRCEAQGLTPQACEQTIVTPKPAGRYLWLPIQESAPEGKVQVIRQGALLMEQNVRGFEVVPDAYHSHVANATGATVASWCRTTMSTMPSSTRNIARFTTTRLVVVG